MKEQKLKRVTASDRRTIRLAVSQNKRHRKWQEAKLDSQFGPHTCGHCRAEPCGSMWPHGACCHRCTHLPMPMWQLTHVLWYRQKPYYVMEVSVRRPGAPTPEERRELERDATLPEPSEAERRGEERRQKLPARSEHRAPSVVTDAAYYRWDGVCQWVRRARAHYFLGVRVSPVEFLRSVPNAEELLEYAPRERPPNPFEEGLVDNPEGELGEPLVDRTEFGPEEPETAERYYKKGLQVVELEEEGEPFDTGEEEDTDDEEG